MSEQFTLTAEVAPVSLLAPKPPRHLIVPAIAAMVLLASCAGEKPGPVKGVWDFQPEKVWEVGEAGGMALRHPAEPRVSDDGRLYFHDFGRRISFILDERGRTVGRFAEPGTGPGKVSRYMNCFLSRTKVVVGAPDRLHFFDRDGSFCRSVPNDLFLSVPLAFVDDHIIFMGPGALCNLPECEVSIKMVNLETGSKKEIYRFEVDPDDNIRFGGVITGLIPQIKMDYDSDSGLIYFGRNDRYMIIAAERDGTVKNTFGLVCDRAPVSEDDKRAHFDHQGIPPSRYEDLLPMLPRTLTCYHRIQVVDRFVFVFRMEELSNKISRQDIDIFSKDGRYLYRGRIVLPPGDYFENPDQLSLGNGYIHVILGGKGVDGEERGSRIARYRVRMPL